MTLTPTSWNMRRELDADRAGADDDDVLGQRVHLEDVVAGDDALAVRVEARQRLDPRAGREDDVGRLQDALAALARRAVLAGLADPDLLRPVEAAAALRSRSPCSCRSSVLSPVHIRFTTASRRAAIAA